MDRMTLSNLYAPNTDNPEFFMETTLGIEQFHNDLKIIGGDLNLAMDLDKDKSGGCHTTHDRSAAFITGYMQLEDMVDIWRECNPEKFQFTWKRTNPAPIPVRLDYMLISEALCRKVEAVEFIPNTHSDHSAVTVHLCANQSELVQDSGN